MDFEASVRQTEFANGIPTKLLSLLLPLAHSRQYPPGTVLFKEGEHYLDFHLILDGHVRLDMCVPIRGRIPLLTVGPGDVLAWSALLAKGRMTTSAIAMNPVWTAAFEGPRLQQLCEAHPELGYHVMKQLATALSQRLLATRLQLLDLFGDHSPAPNGPELSSVSVDPEC